MSVDENSLSHTKWDCKYHIVFSPKIDRPYTYASAHTSKTFCFQFHGIFKREEYADDIREACKFKVQIWKQKVLVLRMVGRNKEAVQRYIKYQQEEDMAEDKMTAKEYVDPFKK